jgi:hypothetical protein
MSETQIPYLPPEIIEHMMKFMIPPTLLKCLKIKYLAKMAHKELYKRYQRCLKVLIELGMNKNGAQKQLDYGKIYLSSVKTKVTDTSVIALAQYCPELINIGLYGCSNITDKSIITIAHNSPNLIWISLGDCTKITDTSVRAIARNCSKLTHIQLLNCSKITDTSIINLVRNCSGLTTIWLGGCSKITDATVISILKYCKILSVISLYNCPNITKNAKKLINNRGIHMY